MNELRRQCARFFREHPRLHALAHPPYLRVRRMLRRGELSRHGAIVPAGDGNDAIRRALLSETPHGVGKIGSLEAEALSCFLGGGDYPSLLGDQLITNVGLFPATAASIDRFCTAYLSALGRIDLLAVWGQPGEAEVIRRAPASPGRTLVHIDSLEPWYHPDPWSGALAGRKVVVLHPFAETIERQYARRREIWPADILPDFDLRTVRMPLSPALRPSRFGNWSAQYDDLVDEIEAKPYDVLIAGAGGISLLAAAHACAAGKIGLHMGGLTQVLFGVLGRRWEKSSFIMARRTTAWTRPAPDETPAASIKVEQGCYW